MIPKIAIPKTTTCTAVRAIRDFGLDLPTLMSGVDRSTVRYNKIAEPI